MLENQRKGSINTQLFSGSKTELSGAKVYYAVYYAGRSTVSWLTKREVVP